MAEYPKADCPDCGLPICVRQMARHRAEHAHPHNLLMVSPEQAQEIIALYRTMGLKDVAERVHWSISSVARVLEAYGIPRRPPGPHARRRVVDAEALLTTCEFYGRGMSMNELAAMMGVSVSTIHRRLHLGGAKIRPSHVDVRRR